MITLSDSELVKLYVSGNESALKTLILRHEQKVFAYIMSSVRNKEIAEDIFQDTFMKVINTLRSGTYKEEGKFLQWVLRIANNLKIDYFRREQRLPVFDNSSDYDIFDLISENEPSIEQKLVMKQIYADAESLLQYLPEEQREVLKLRIYQDISFKDIADMTHVSINTALGRMRYALMNLRKIIEEKNLVLC